MQGHATWDLFCRVVDNYGDIGVCWRLAEGLAAMRQQVRLWTDDASALRWMAPQGAAGVQVGHWSAAEAAAPGDVVVEAFACDPPPAFVAAMAARREAPVWINLEYLSAEPWVERCHGLPSPQAAGPGRGMTKWFFHPGFTPGTGGLLREAGLLQERDAFDRAAWLAGQGLPGPNADEQVVSLFCYPTAPWRELPAALNRPSLLLLAQGAAQALADLPLPPGIRTATLPWMTQHDFDRLLWASDLNLVRGEDSLARALWAGKPTLWQLYPQDDGAHIAKLEAFLSTWARLSGATEELAARQSALLRWWNGAPGAPQRCPGGPDATAWMAASTRLAVTLAQQPDLVSALLDFARRKGAPEGGNG